jgi:hypothetical protein
LRATGAERRERCHPHARRAESPQRRAHERGRPGDAPDAGAERDHTGGRPCRDRRPPAHVEHATKRADRLDGVDRNQLAAVVAASHAQRDGVARVVVEDGALDHRRPPAADDLEAVAARQPVGSDRTRLVERPRTQRLE